LSSGSTAYQTPFSRIFRSAGLAVDQAAALFLPFRAVAGLHHHPPEPGQTGWQKLLRGAHEGEPRFRLVGVVMDDERFGVQVYDQVGIAFGEAIEETKAVSCGSSNRAVRKVSAFSSKVSIGSVVINASIALNIGRETNQHLNALDWKAPLYL
jgi:hypothetical protein